MEALIEHLRAGNDLSSAQVQEAAHILLDEEAGVADRVDFLSALAKKGETVAEISDFVQAFLAEAVSPGLDQVALNKPTLDVCGTGGDHLNLFNVSTTAMFLQAATGIAVVKHGNRGITSKSGGADVLEALGIRIDLPPAEFCECVNQTGVGFLFAPLYHPAFKAVGPVRARLAEGGQRSIFNILGPLLNPVQPHYQVVGVFDETLPAVFAEILGTLGRHAAWVVHGKTADGRGVDELSTMGETRIAALNPDGTIEEGVITPEALGIPVSEVGPLQGGDARENAAILEGILNGEIRDGRRDLVCLNAAAGMALAKATETLPEALSLAHEVLDSGEALAVLRKMQSFSANV